MSFNDVVDLTVEDPAGDRSIEVLEPGPPLKKRFSAKRQRLEREFQMYLASLNPRDRTQVQNSFATVVQEKQDIISLRQRYLKKSDSPEEEETRPLVVELLDSALLQLDEAVVNIRAGSVSVDRCKELAQRARKKTKGVRGRIDGIRQNAALHRLQESTESRDRTNLLHDPAYVESRAGSMVTPQPTTTRGMYQPLTNPASSNQELLRRAFDDPDHPGQLPDGNVISPFDRGAYMRAIQGRGIGSRPLEDPSNFRAVLGSERGLGDQDSAYEDDSDDEESSAQRFGYQGTKNYDELVDLAMTEAEPLDMPPQMECFPLEHQRQGLGWLVRAERGRNRGGILADDMGLGKTVQTIALLYANPPPPAAPEVEHRLVLIVCPVALIATWQEELKNRVQRQHRLKVYIHHKGMNGTGFLTSAAAIVEEADVVVCTYHGIVNEYKQLLKKVQRERQLRDSSRLHEPEIRYGVHPLFEIKWHRVVLDEAHLIKNRMSQMSLAVSKLESRYRLALTGTPMQNRLDELFPLIRFLNILPYSEYADFKKLLPPEKSSTTHDFETQKALATFLSAVMLRRRKDTIIAGKKIIDNLPPKHITDYSFGMEGDELEQYQTLEKGIREEVNRVPTSEEVTMSNMLVFLLRMRQAADHPYLIAITKKSASQRIWGKNKDTREAIDKAMKVDARVRLAALDASPQERVCAECDSDASNMSYSYVMAGCGHFLCSECATNAQDDLDSSEEARQPCPICLVHYRFIANLEILDIIETHHPRNVSATLELLLAGQRPRVEELRREEENRKRRLNELRLGSQMNRIDEFLYDSETDPGSPGTESTQDFDSASSASSPMHQKAGELDKVGPELNGRDEMEHHHFASVSAPGSPLDQEFDQLDKIGSDLNERDEMSRHDFESVSAPGSPLDQKFDQLDGPEPNGRDEMIDLDSANAPRNSANKGSSHVDKLGYAHGDSELDKTEAAFGGLDEMKLDDLESLSPPRSTVDKGLDQVDKNPGAFGGQDKIVLKLPGSAASQHDNAETTVTTAEMPAETEGTAEENAAGDQDGDGSDQPDPLEYKLDINEIAKLFRVPKIFEDGWTSSAKVEACLDCLRSIWRDAPDEKVIIFSSFTSLLDVLAIPLEAAVVPYALYTGKMNVQERNATLDEFRRGRCKVLLTSLKAGNVGLTLTQANRVIIVEPFWNPYVEDQAQDRVHRIGQSREVTIYRMRIKDTVEDRIVDLQKTKRALIEGALDNSMKTRAQGLSRTDIMYALGLRRKPRSAESILRRPGVPVSEPNANRVITTQTLH